MRINLQQKLFVAAVLLVNVVLWIVPSDVAELVARDRHTLLGRYSREHFAWILGLIPISIGAVYIHLSPNNAAKKKKAMRVTAIVLAVFLPLFAFDIYLRLAKEWNYELGGSLAYHRPPNASFDGVFRDIPQAIRTYPNPASGYGDVHWTLTSDERGFRNPPNPTIDRFDILVLGDSFAEGSRVSDDQCWPRVLGEVSGRTVYNLGMSGYAPQHFLASLEEYGPTLRPQWVVCLLYEGNDFHGVDVDDKPPSIWGNFFKRSPLIDMIDEVLIRTLGPIGADRPLPSLDVVSWMPVHVPGTSGETVYAFSPSDVLRLYIDRMDFEEGKKWTQTRELLGRIGRTSRALGARLILLYAPVKPHVVLPMIEDQLPKDDVRAFADLRAKHDLPDAETFWKELRSGMEVKENLTRQWCEENGILFVSLTDPLREAIRDGRQVYYAYDEHWSPAGHAVAGKATADFLIQIFMETAEPENGF